MLWLKSWSTREAFCYPAFMGNHLNISHTCYTYLPSRWIILFVPNVAEQNQRLIRWNEEGRRVQDFPLLPQRLDRFLSDLPQARWHNLLCVECLQMIKLMVVGLCSTGRLCCSGWWVWDLRTCAQFQWNEMSPGLFQDFIDGYIKP